MGDRLLGVIGGSGLYDIPELENKELIELSTPFGQPSAPFMCGQIRKTRIAFLPRHGAHHSLLPSEINYRANIHGFRQMGVRTLLSVSAVGSLREEIHPGDMVLPKQFIDRTQGRPNTFFGEGAVAHVQFGDPVCPRLVEDLAKSLNLLKVRHHCGGKHVVIEGPAFSTRAESELFRSWQADVVGMTGIPEAKLAREAEICYATLALSTDYDCWHKVEKEVSVDVILEVLRKNIAVAQRVIVQLAADFSFADECSCQQALEGALVTAPSKIPPATRQRLQLLIGRFLK